MTLTRLAAATSLALLSLPIFAQTTGLGRITGTVSDATGLVVSAATVTASNADTGEVRQASTNASGVYVISPLPLGNYSLQVRREGFKTSTRSGLRIDVNSTLTVDVALEVGSVSESVTVEARAATIETENAAIGNSRYDVQLKNLPVIVRELQTLVGQTAGVPYGTTDTVGGSFNQGGRSAMQILSDGAQVNALQTTGWPAIDGIGRRADLSLPSIDAVTEVKWTTSGGNAEYSQPTQVIVASRSGTNEFHGSAFEFYRSGGLGARRWEAANRESFVRHQFGGTLAGPLKKDKMFFLASADIFRHKAGLISNARYPTAAERSGDLRSLLQRTDAQGRPAPVTIYDPLAASAPFPNNTIPANRFNAVSVELLKLIPDAPLPGRVTDFNAIYFKPQFDNSEKYDGRWDYNINEKDKVFARFTIGHLDQASRYSGDVPGPHGSSTKNQWNQTVAANYTRIVDPSMIFVFQFTFRNLPFKNIPSLGDQVFPVKMNDLNPQPPFGGPPAIAIGSNGLGIGALFDRLLFNFSADYSYTFDPTMTKTIGNHTVKAGATFLKGYKTTELASPPYGRFTTASDFNNPRSTNSATGDAFADFLLGYPNSTDVTIGDVGGFQRKTNWHLFLQDDWKVTQRLTLNLGLRYDNFGFFEDWKNRAAVADFQSGKILIPDGSQNKIQPAYQPFADRFLPASQAGLSDTFIKPNNFDISPRAGFAYRVKPDFVLRGGFGIYYVDVTVNEFRGAINVAPFVRRAQLSRSLLISQNVNVNSLYTFTNPTANSNAAGADTQLTTLDGFNPKYPTQRAYTWNFTIEKELGRQFGLRSSYAGNTARYLSRTVRVNSCAPGPTECLARAANDPTRRRWSQFGLNAGQRFGDGDANYNAFEIELQKRFAGGLLFDVNYAYSRTFRLDPTASNPISDPKWRYDYGLVPAQPANIFHWNYVWEIPYGKGRKFGSRSGAILNTILGEWMFAGLGTWQSGQPLTITTANGQSPTGATTNRADRIADGRLGQSGRSRPEKSNRWFDTAAYVNPAFIDARATRPTRQFGSAGSGTVIGPSFFTFDFQLQKTFTLMDRYRLQFRAEMFNPTNTPMLANPDTNVVSSNFGRIRASNASYTPRNLQLGFRLDF
jgi:hypothetical protein